jgi:hypothetical protein
VALVAVAPLVGVRVVIPVVDLLLLSLTMAILAGRLLMAEELEVSSMRAQLVLNKMLLYVILLVIVVTQA